MLHLRVCLYSENNDATTARQHALYRNSTKCFELPKIKSGCLAIIAKQDALFLLLGVGISALRVSAFIDT